MTREQRSEVYALSDALMYWRWQLYKRFAYPKLHASELQLKHDDIIDDYVVWCKR